MRQHTVNVIEMEQDDILRLTAFDASAEGRQAASDLFCELAKERDTEASEEDLRGFLEESYYETGDYQLFLVESVDREV
jgi:hypothetical protein